MLWSRLLGSPSRPPDRPWSPSASTTRSTPLSSSEGEVVTCSSRLRAETRQLIFLSRSPARNGRMSANSMPEPSRGDRFTPTSPTGRGVSARESNREVTRQHPQPLTVQRHRPPPVARPRRGQADQLLPQHPPPPAPRPDLDDRQLVDQAGDEPRRRVQRDVRRGRHRAGDVLDVLAVVELAAARWCPGPRAASGGRAGPSSVGAESGRCSSARQANSTNGAPSTIATGAPPTTAATTATAPTTTARARAGVGRQLGTSPALERRRGRHLGEHRVDDGAAAGLRHPQLRAGR